MPAFSSFRQRLHRHASFASNTPTTDPFTCKEPPPPAYTAAQAFHPTPFQDCSTTIPMPTADDPLAFLSTFDTILVVDDSGSMAGRSWRECAAALAALAPICTARDADGLDLYFLNAPDRPHHHHLTAPAAVADIFAAVRPGGATPTGQRLNAILRPYLRAFEADPAGTKPVNIVVITDGVPSDDVESVLIGVAQRLDRLDAVPWQVGVQMFQVGDEAGAREHLAGLDDELARLGGGCRDIVDTVPFAGGRALSAEGILKTVLGAVNRRLDRSENI